MIAVVVCLLVLWLACGIIGLLFKGLLWLTIVCVVLFLGTAAVALVQRNTRR